jgi:hypothetical protein
MLALSARNVRSELAIRRYHPDDRESVERVMEIALRDTDAFLRTFPAVPTIH